ncbi:MAG: hypothetical protein HY681_01775 [Chloroflexi bacterium]|nr:hypothetical protein [Chloroflexota bacterium]
MLNGPWRFTALDLPVGGYYLSVRAQGGDYVDMPSYSILVPEKGIVWRMGGTMFRFVTLEQFVEEHGAPPCQPQNPQGPRPCGGAIAGVAIRQQNSVKGSVSGLAHESKATASIYRLPIVEGRCYSEWPSSMAGGCTPSPAPEPLDGLPPVSPDDLLVQLDVTGDVWGYQGDGLSPGSYLVVLELPGYKVQPAAYIYDVQFQHLMSDVRGGLNFVLAKE